jgi:hypothetical protein
MAGGWLERARERRAGGGGVIGRGRAEAVAR